MSYKQIKPLLSGLATIQWIEVRPKCFLRYFVDSSDVKHFPHELEWIFFEGLRLLDAGIDYDMVCALLLPDIANKQINPIYETMRLKGNRK